MRRWIMLLTVLVTLSFTLGVADTASAQAAPAAAVNDATAEDAPGEDAADKLAFWNVVTSSGLLGDFIWLGLFATLFGGIWFSVDCGITVRATKIMPQTLVDRVTEAMAQGDVLKALKACEDEPGPMANILTAGFSHVEEGFEVIQEAVGVAATMESETLMQRIQWISVMASISPLLGLLGTVQGMILAFGDLARMGAAVISVLAVSIAQALYTTAAGLTAAIPCVCSYYIFKNKASKIILRMEAITMELIKDLRNVEVVQE